MPLPEARVALLSALAGVLARHLDTPEKAGLEAMRLLRTAGMTWRDVLGPVFPPDDYLLKLASYGHRLPTHGDCGRAVLTFLHLATPFEAAVAAVLANKPDLTPAEAQLLASIVWRLIAANATEEEVHLSTAQRMP